MTYSNVVGSQRFTKDDLLNRLYHQPTIHALIIVTRSMPKTASAIRSITVMSPPGLCPGKAVISAIRKPSIWETIVMLIHTHTHAYPIIFVHVEVFTPKRLPTSMTASSTRMPSGWRRKKGPDIPTMKGPDAFPECSPVDKYCFHKMICVGRSPHT